MLGHADQPQGHMRPHVAGPYPHVGAVRANYLDDRADVADLSILAVVGFQRLHLGGNHLPHLALINRHGLGDYRRAPAQPLLLAALLQR